LYSRSDGSGWNLMNWKGFERICLYWREMFKLGGKVTAFDQEHYGDS
jgi:hypothetical protein